MQSGRSGRPGSFERVLRPRGAWWRLDWRRLLQRRNMLYLLVRRDFVARYQQTVLGPAWFILQPLNRRTGAFTLVFRAGSAPRPTASRRPSCSTSAACSCGVFLRGARHSRRHLQANATVFTKVYFRG